MTTECDNDGVVYARVSSPEQAKTGNSLDAQVDQMERKAEELGINLVRKPIRDEGETGTDFDRSGIQKVLQLAQNGSISHLLVDEVDRLGRAHVQTLYRIHILEVKYGVTIVTASGPLDFTLITGKIQTTWQTLVAEMEVRNQGAKALRAKARSFLEDKNWGSWYNTIPLGYIPKPGGWIMVDKQTQDLAQAMFEFFVDTKSYAETVEKVNASETLESNLSVSELKQHLQRSVYKGQPSIPIEDVEGYDHKGWLDEPQLQIVGECTWEEAQRIIDDIAEEYSQQKEANDVDDFVDKYGLLPVFLSSPIVRLHCPTCKSLMVQNGKRTLRDSVVRHLYKCSNEDCGDQRVWPNEEELNIMEILDKLDSMPGLPDWFLNE